jgi:hypothetical protein
VGVSGSNPLGTTKSLKFGGLASYGGLAQLARAPALHAGGQRFESVILHGSLQKSKDLRFEKIEELAQWQSIPFR